jgi:hypothetical protein
MEPECSLPRYNSPPTVFILIQIHPAHAPFPQSYFYFNITPPSTPKCYKWSLALTILHKDLNAPLLSPVRVNHYAVSSGTLQLRPSWEMVEFMKLIIKEFFHHTVTSLSLGSEALHISLFSNTLSSSRSTDTGDKFRKYILLFALQIEEEKTRPRNYWRNIAGIFPKLFPLYLLMNEILRCSCHKRPTKDLIQI